MGTKPATANVKRGQYLATVPPQEIVPVINSRFESSVRGIFVIGDVTGLPLVKVAANQGREVIEQMERNRVVTPESNLEEGLDIVIIGGGPAGLSAGIEAQKRGWKYVVLERSKAASTVRSFPPGKKVYAEPQSIDSLSELDVGQDRDKDDFLNVIKDSIEKHDLSIKEETEVARVRKNGEIFEVETRDGKSFPCRNVIVAVGRQGQPRLLSVPGADKSHKVTYRFHTVEDYVEKKVLVVGGGNSAIEAALLLKDRNDVTLSYRGDNFYRAKEENRLLIEAAERKGELNIIYESQVQEIEENQVSLKTSNGVETIPNDKRCYPNRVTTAH